MTPTLAIVGPTASGKSEVALELARQQGGELVSCDSVQVYRGFVVGCAKATAEERAVVPHHLLDVVDWHEPFDAQRYVELATDALSDIRARERLPILCGGTGLYLRTLRFGLIDAPAPSPELRERLYGEERASPGCLYARLQALDFESAKNIEPHNTVYVVRALEIFETTGKPASVLRAEHAFREERHPMQVVLLQWEPTVLRQRIRARTQAMLRGGLLDEVAGLLAAGVDPNARPMRAVGYKEACEVVQGQAPSAGLDERIAVATWAYARRQRTWFRKERDVRVLELSSVAAAVATLAERPR